MSNKHIGILKEQKGLRDFLDQSGVLESKDESLIKKVREAYWRNYQKHYKREKRSRGMECVIVLNEIERKAFEKRAKKHKTSIPSLIKNSAFAYLEKYYMSPSKELFNSIMQKLSRIYTDIERLLETRIHNPEGLKQVLQSIEHIEQKLEDITKHPPDLEEEIKRALHDVPTYQETLLKILKDYDNQIKSKKIN